jgi:hypothetical protein
MSAIQSINYNIPAIYSPQRRAVQNVQNIDGKIAKIDRKLESNNQIISLYYDKKEKLQNLIKSNDEYIKTLQESKALGEKRIVLLQESKALDRERINALHTVINGLQALIDRAKGLNVAPALSKELEALSKKDAVLKEQTAVIDDKAAKLAIKVEHQGKELAKLGSNAPPATTSENQAVIVSSKDTSQVVQVYQPTTDQVRSISLANLSGKEWDDRWIDKSTVRIEKIKNEVMNIVNNPPVESRYKAEWHISKIERMMDSLDDRMWASRSILQYHSSDEQKPKYLQLVEDDTILLNKLKESLARYNIGTNIQKADRLLTSGQYDKALKAYDEIIEKTNILTTEADENYRPLDEQLRLTAKEYMNLQKIEERSNLNIFSNQDLVVSYITAHVNGHYSVNKSEVINMISNQFFYSPVDVPKPLASENNIYESITNNRKGAEVTKPANVLDSDTANTLNIRQETIDRNIKFTRPIIEAKLQEYPLLNSDKVKLKASELISNKYSNIDLSKNQTRLNLFRLNLDNIISLLLK